MGHHLSLPALQLAISSRLERVRFLLLSKESEEHARRSLLLGWFGLFLGVVSLILGIILASPTPPPPGPAFPMLDDV